VTAFEVREAREADGPPLYAAWQRLRAHNEQVDRRVIPAPVSELEFVNDFRQRLTRPRSVSLVAEVEGELAGFIAGNIERNQPDRLPEEHATIGYLWVEERFRRGGIARALVARVADWARDHEGVAHFEMAVLTADTAAAGFWRALGFTPFIERLWAPLTALEEEA
jgi:ribosomal protein S18 acetylase RimI-like enzyme